MYASYIVMNQASVLRNTNGISFGGDEGEIDQSSFMPQPCLHMAETCSSFY